MNTRTYLWRLVGTFPDDHALQTRWRDGIQLHIQHAPLTASLIKIGAEQRAYLRTGGCAGCTEMRCIPGCPSALLRRLVKYCFTGGDLRPLTHRHGLKPRSYPQIGLIRPGRSAQALDHTLLAAWHAARLDIQWNHTRRDATAIAIVAAGDKTPAIPAVVAEQGWVTFPVPVPLGRTIIKTQMPLPSLLAGNVRIRPFVPLPAPVIIA